MAKNNAIDPSRIFTRQQVDDLLTAAINKTLLEVDKAKLFAHHEGCDKVKGIADDIIEESVLGCKKDSKQEPDILVDGVLTELKTTGMIELKKKDSSYVYECKKLVIVYLHNKTIPVPSAKKLSEFFQRIPVVVYIVCDADFSMQSVIFQPTSNTRRTLQLTLGMVVEQINDFFCTGPKVHLSSANNLFLHHFSCSNKTYLINNPSSTSVQRTLPRTLFLYTTRNYPNRLNHQIDFSSSRKSANGWNGEYLLNNGCTPVHCLGHSSNSQASAPS